MDLPFLMHQPYWQLVIIVISIMLVSLETGFRLGRHKRQTSELEDKIGSNIAVTSIFATVGLILAFTYAYTVSRADIRKDLILEEANAISTAFLRSDLVNDYEITELKRALLEYARSRVITKEELSSRESMSKFLQRSYQLQAKLWPITKNIVQKKTPGPLEVSLITAINEVLDLYTARIAGGMDRLPAAIVIMILLISAASLAVAGFNSGLYGRFSRWRMTTLAIAISLVILVIIDFDYPKQGFIHLNQHPILSVIAEMEQASLSNKQ